MATDRESVCVVLCYNMIPITLKPARGLPYISAWTVRAQMLPPPEPSTC